MEEEKILDLIPKLKIRVKEVCRGLPLICFLHLIFYLKQNSSEVRLDPNLIICSDEVAQFKL